uniref:Uncharacterized protein n=1 Tax=Ascaris lumbricoides TaxID=6252 RepID=A0A0M3HWH4_ASCLU
MLWVAFLISQSMTSKNGSSLFRTTKMGSVPPPYSFVKNS